MPCCTPLCYLCEGASLCGRVWGAHTCTGRRHHAGCTGVQCHPCGPGTQPPSQDFFVTQLWPSGHWQTSQCCCVLQVHLFVEESGAPTHALADSIVQVAQECSATFVVMARSVRSPWTRLLAGSVTQDVQKQLHCPVVLVP